MSLFSCKRVEKSRFRVAKKLKEVVLISCDSSTQVTEPQWRCLMRFLFASLLYNTKPGGNYTNTEMLRNQAFRGIKYPRGAKPHNPTCGRRGTLRVLYRPPKKPHRKVWFFFIFGGFLVTFEVKKYLFQRRTLKGNFIPDFLPAQPCAGSFCPHCCAFALRIAGAVPHRIKNEHAVSMLHEEAA